jgi:hypothetical protein
MIANYRMADLKMEADTKIYATHLRRKVTP